MDEYYDEEHDPVEGYCVRCRDSIEIEDAQAVWTRKGMPATRGACPICGGTVFRMGKTYLHSGTQRPEAVEVTGGGKQPRLPRDTVYVLYAEADEALARQLAVDLEKAGIAPWLHEHTPQDVQWAGGVHPALQECSRMLLVLSPAALDADAVTAGWQFFRGQRKPILIAQVESAPPPDDIRRSPRFDFTGDYKRAFRQMMQALG